MCMKAMMKMKKGKREEDEEMSKILNIYGSLLTLIDFQYLTVLYLKKNLIIKIKKKLMRVLMDHLLEC